MKFMGKRPFALTSALALVFSLSAAINTKATLDCTLEGMRPGIMTISTGQINSKTGAIKVSGSLVLEGGSKHSVAGTVYGETHKGGCCGLSGWSAGGSVKVKGYGNVYLDLFDYGLEGTLTGGEGDRDEECTYEVGGTPRSKMSAYCGKFSGRSFVWVTESYENCFTPWYCGDDDY